MSESKSQKKKLSKDIISIIRTTMRNNIELTHIADNKANVLLTLNSLMLTFLIPLIIPHISMIKEMKLYLPLILLIGSGLVTIYMAIMVLKPSSFHEKQRELKKGRPISPFFFGNYFQMNREEFGTYIKSALSDRDKLESHIVEDLHYIGARLGRKLSLIRLAFNVFMVGMFGSILLTFLCFLVFAP